MSFDSFGKRKPWTKFGANRVEGDDSPAVVWHLAGLFTDCKEAYAFLDGFREGVRKEDRPQILDMGEIDHVTSTGAGILAACFCSATNAGKKMCLAGVSERDMAMLKIVGLARVIDIHSTRQEALQDLSG